MPSQPTVLQQLQTLIADTTSQLFTPAGVPQLVPAPSHIAADLASNWPLVLFAQFTAKDKARLKVNSPKELATKLKIKLEAQANFSSLVARITVASPGFLNLVLASPALWQSLPIFADAKVKLIPQSLKGQYILVEYADPNPFKEFHIGHLLNITVGEAILRLLRAAGARTVPVCYQGDVGMHVAKSLWGMRRLFAEEKTDLLGLSQQPLTERIKFLGRAYAVGATAYKDNKKAKLAMQEINLLAFLASQERLKKEAGMVPRVDYAKGHTPDMVLLAEIKELYTAGRKWSLQYFDTIYERLGTKFSEYFFESQSAEYGYSIVKQHIAEGIFTDSEGAVVFLGEKEGLHNRVFINSLGLPTYEAKDMGLPLLKQDRLGEYDLSIIITANEVDEYFKVVLRALAKVFPQLAAKTKHLSHGVVRLPEGKMSSRTGNVVTGSWLLDESQARILAILSTTQPSMKPKKKRLLADKLAVTAIKYALLKSNLGTNITFSFTESLSFSGNSGPYLQYTLVRCQSILQKAADQWSKRSITKLIDTLLNNKIDFDSDLKSSERDVLLYLFSYIDTVESAATEYAPHLLCTYLFALAQRFSRFYESCPILKNPAIRPSLLQQRRLLLVIAVRRILREGMDILGMPVVEQM